MKKLPLLLLLALSMFTTVFSQENPDEFKPTGKPLALIFTNFHTTSSDGETVTEFENTRAYLGYEYNFSKEFYAKVVFDVGDPNDGGALQLTAFLKNAYVQYKKEKLNAYFGMIATTQFKASEKLWGNRYMMKSFQDEYKFNASADLGVTFEYEFADFISADFSVFNGEGYKNVQSDKYVRPALGVSLTPAKGLFARAYVDQMGGDVKQQSLATLLAYSNKKLVVAGEYNYQTNYKMIDGQDMYGTSFYATYQLEDKWEVYARYDDLNSKAFDGEQDGWNVGKDGQLMLAGIEYAPVKGIKFSPNVRFWNPDLEGAKNTTFLFLSAEVKF